VVELRALAPSVCRCHPPRRGESARITPGSADSGGASGGRFHTPGNA
jgi:hypothetical protein